MARATATERVGGDVGGRAAIGALVLVLLLGLAACSDAPPPVVGQVPAAPAPVPQIEPDPTQLRLGVDDLGIGFNPHRLADLGPVSRAASSLVLPSAFRLGPDGVSRPDPNVISSARVTSTEPYTVTYEIAPAATWSDNAPVAAEDFVYLWQQMRSQPGVAGPAGYRAISDVRSRAGGKGVDVVFDRPYPAWPRLFDALLPAHLLKDAPGSWGGALQDSIPVSAGPYAVRVVDRIRGEVTLARNDRFWGAPGVSDQIVLQAADHAALVDRVRTGDVQALQLRAGGIDLAALAAAPTATSGVVARPVPEAELVDLVLRSDAGPLADPRVRRAVVAAIDRDALVAAGTAGGPSAALRADAFATAPSQGGYRSTLPATSPAAGRDLTAVARELADAGYDRDGEGRWTRDGRPLTLRLAAPPQVAPYGRLLPTLAAELNGAGIATAVVADSGSPGFPPGRGPIPSTTPAPTPGGDPGPTPVPGATTLPAPATTGPVATGALPSGTASSTASTSTSVPPIPKSPSDLVVADVSLLALPVGGDPVADLISSVGCPGQRAPRTTGTRAPAPTSSAAPTTTSAAPAAGVPGGSAPSTSAAPTSTSAPTTSSEADGLATPQASEALSPSGYCDPALQSVLDAASSGALGRDTALALAEPLLWAAVPVVPLFQASSVVAGAPGRADLVPTALGVSPLSTADRWPPPARLARANGDSN